jgi:hypothetical protein
MPTNLVIHSSVVASLGQSINGLNNAKHIIYAAKWAYVKGKIVTLVAAQALETFSDLFRASLKFTLYITTRTLFCLYGPKQENQAEVKELKTWQDNQCGAIAADLSKDAQVIEMLIRSLLSPTCVLNNDAVKTVVTNIQKQDDKKLLSSSTNHLMERMIIISSHSDEIGVVSNVWFRVIAILSLVAKSVDVISLLLTTTVIVVEESVVNVPSALALGDSTFFNVMKTRINNQWLKIKNEFVDAQYHIGMIIKPMNNEDMKNYILKYQAETDIEDMYPESEQINLDMYKSSN